MPSANNLVSARPVTNNQFSQYVATSGFDLVTSCGVAGVNGAGVSDWPVVCIQAIARPSAYLLGPGMAALASQLSTYYGGGKAASVLLAMGVPTAPPLAGRGGEVLPGAFPWFGVAEDFTYWHVLAADAAAQLTATITLLGTGGNTQKGGNP